MEVEIIRKWGLKREIPCIVMDAFGIIKLKKDTNTYLKSKKSSTILHHRMLYVGHKNKLKQNIERQIVCGCITKSYNKDISCEI